ncbi:MAG: response regulator [Armatimonadetes bacterium]|nr:response regulator [Armatimonadota bacterium]
MGPLTILVVDDEQSICMLLKDVLERFGHSVTTCNDGAAGVAQAQETSFDLVFCDIRMPGMSGLEAMKQIRALQPQATFVMITGYAKDDIIDEALQSGASACLCKPFSLSQVTELLKEITSGEKVSA